MNAEENRIKISLRRLKVLQRAKFGDIYLIINEKEDLEVAGWSNYSDIKNINKEIALAEIGAVKYSFLEVIENYPEVKAFIKGRNIMYCLYYDDGGKASMNICSMIDDILEWQIDF